jgi:hypothetical protein
MRRLLPILTAACLLSGGGSALRGAEPRLLVLVLDAVPHDLVSRLVHREQDPIFQDLAGPTAVVSTFPSTTTLAITGILAPLGLGRSPGYEARFFDRRRGVVRGAGPVSYSKIIFPWRESFDWKIDNPARKAIGYLRPQEFVLHELRTGLQAFADSDDPVFYLYVDASDVALHLEGPDRLGETLVEIDRILRDFRQRYPYPFHLVMMSDHGIAGGDALVNVMNEVEDRLKDAGFRVADDLSGPHNVVFVPFGLLSSFVVHTRYGEEARVGHLITSLSGVDLCATAEEPGRWRVFSESGEATFARRTGETGTSWRYDALTADPLRYLPVVEHLQSRAGASDRRWFPDSWWFQATTESRYPDGLFRLAQSFELVENPASLTCSVAPGHMFGADITEFGAVIGGRHRLRWTHGGLHRQETLGFLMSDVPGWEAPAYVRFDQALVGLVPVAQGEQALEANLSAHGAR